MKVLLAGFLLLLAAPAVDAADADVADASVPGCHGIVLDSQFTGACIHGCYGGTAYIDGRWFASWPCTFVA